MEPYNSHINSLGDGESLGWEWHGYLAYFDQRLQHLLNVLASGSVAVTVLGVGEKCAFCGMVQTDPYAFKGDRKRGCCIRLRLLEVGCNLGFYMCDTCVLILNHPSMFYS